MRMIEADKVPPMVRLLLFNNQKADSVMRYVQDLVDKHTIEAEPVRHGYWLWDSKHYYCSVCSGTRYHDLVLGLDAAYCPYCGAKMGEAKDGTK